MYKIINLKIVRLVMKYKLKIQKIFFYKHINKSLLIVGKFWQL